MNQDQLTLMNRFCVSLIVLFALPVKVIIRHFRFGTANNGGVDRLYDCEGDYLVAYDCYCQKGGSWFYSVDAEGAACF